MAISTQAARAFAKFLMDNSGGGYEDEAGQPPQARPQPRASARGTGRILPTPSGTDEIYGRLPQRNTSMGGRMLIAGARGVARNNNSAQPFDLLTPYDDAYYDRQFSIQEQQKARAKRAAGSTNPQSKLGRTQQSGKPRSTTSSGRVQYRGGSPSAPEDLVENVPVGWDDSYLGPGPWPGTPYQHDTQGSYNFDLLRKRMQAAEMLRRAVNPNRPSSLGSGGSMWPLGIPSAQVGDVPPGLFPTNQVPSGYRINPQINAY